MGHHSSWLLRALIASHSVAGCIRTPAQGSRYPVPPPPSAHDTTLKSYMEWLEDRRCIHLWNEVDLRP